MDNLKDLLGSGDIRDYFTKSQGSLYEFYLSGEILEPENYIEWFDVIRNASEQDTIKIYINSGGGDLNTALQFLRVLGDSSARVVCSVEGACMSAATMIFLCADEFQVTPHSLFMFHNYSGGTFGKGGEMHDQIMFERAWSQKFLAEIYKHFLSDGEILGMLANREIWLTSEEVLERLTARQAAYKDNASLTQG